MYDGVAPTTSGIANQQVNEDAGPTVIDLKAAFEDAENGDIYTTGLRLVVPDENSPVKADEMPKDIPHERRTLNEFREWLKRYNLSSS